MTQPVIPEPKFAALSEAEIQAALADPDPANPVAVEFARLIEGYTRNFAAHVERLGYIPEMVLHGKPLSAIEAVAMRYMTEIIREQTAAARGKG